MSYAERSYIRTKSGRSKQRPTEKFYQSKPGSLKGVQWLPKRATSRSLLLVHISLLAQK